VLLMVLTPLGFIIVTVCVVRWETRSGARSGNSAAASPEDVVAKSLGDDSLFDANASSSDLIDEAQEYSRKGRLFENGRKDDWEINAYRMYHASRVRLDSLPLSKVHEEVCFAIDREAACAALSATITLVGSSSLSLRPAAPQTSTFAKADTLNKYMEARDLYVRLANIWHTLKSNASVAEEAAHHTSLSLHKAMLCCLAANDPWTADKVIELGFELDDASFRESA
jgi:hypothetical protein